MSGALLHLAGPMQSWGVHGDWNERDTASYPTRSGLIGMVAAAYGHPRGHSLNQFAPLRFTIRIDDPGERIVDYHTVGGGYPQHETPPKTGDRKPRPEGKGTIVTHRHYLSGAAFTVAVTAPSKPELVDDVIAALRQPYWAPYLGRRSCPPTGPLVLATGVTDPQDQLRQVPLHRTTPRNTGQIDVEFVADADIAPRDDRVETLRTSPADFDQLLPTYHVHTVHRWHEPLPAALCGDRGRTWISNLAAALT